MEKELPEKKLKWLAQSNPYIVTSYCGFDSNDFYDSADEEVPRCLPHSIIPKQQLEQVLLASSIKYTPQKPKVSNSHMITPYERKMRLTENGEISPSTGIVYQYIKDLKLIEEYDHMVTLQLYKQLPIYKNIPACKLFLIGRTFKQDMGFLITVFSNMTCAVCFVVKNGLADKAGIRFGDQILEVDHLMIKDYLVLDRLVMSPSSSLPLLIRQNPFLETFRIQIEKGVTMGFNIRDGEILYLKEGSSAQKRNLKLDHQIIEVNGECAIGWDDTELERTIRNAAVIDKKREVNLTIMPRRIYRRIIRRVDGHLIRRRALLKF